MYDFLVYRMILLSVIYSFSSDPRLSQLRLESLAYSLKHSRTVEEDVCPWLSQRCFVQQLQRQGLPKRLLPSLLTSSNTRIRWFVSTHPLFSYQLIELGIVVPRTVVPNKSNRKETRKQGLLRLPSYVPTDHSSSARSRLLACAVLRMEAKSVVADLSRSIWTTPSK